MPRASFNCFTYNRGVAELMNYLQGDNTRVRHVMCHPRQRCRAKLDLQGDLMETSWFGPVHITIQLLKRSPLLQGQSGNAGLNQPRSLQSGERFSLHV
jgi:hypothetical protein